MTTQVACEGTQTPDKTLAAANVHFALDLYQELVKSKPNQNLFFSPGSISVALAMTYLGARGDTAQQMRQVLKFDTFKDDELLHRTFKELIASFQKSDKLILHTANRIFAQQSFDFSQKYLDDSKEIYEADLSKVNFAGDFEGARAHINNWVGEKTAQKIKDLLPNGSLNALTRMVLVNAVYFKGDWMNKFNERGTRPGDFTALDGTKVKVPMMFLKKKLSFGLNKSLQTNAVELPYAGGTMSFFILLPEPGKYEHFEKTVKVSDITSCEQSFSMSTGEDIELLLPKFKMEDSFNLSETLQSLGMRDLFSEASSDLSGIEPTRQLFVSSVQHKAFLEVNEEGSEAAAATAVVMQMRCMVRSWRVHCDRPFMFFIRENTTRSILFLGRMAKPDISQ